jgi:membrane protease YdiL (CAAX protease family)
MMPSRDSLAAASSPAPAPAPRPGPGLPEACLWTALFHLCQLVVLVLLIAGLLWCASERFPPPLQETLRIADLLEWDSSFLFAGVASLAAMLVIVPAVRWRVGPRLREEFGLRRLSPREGLLITAAVAPLGILSDQVYRWGLDLMHRLVVAIPELAKLPQLDSMEIVQRQMSGTPYPILLVAIALAPAVSEEFVFRGLIGRGLIARWGVVGGIGLTSLLFAAAHGAPAHALATLPVAICLHLVYRITGNLWGPVLLHGLLNALSVTLMKLQAESAQPTHPALLCAAAGFLLAVMALLRDRTWSAVAGTGGDPSAAVPHSPPVRRLPPACTLRPALAACSIISYTCVVVWMR